jgi:hypothetical protein
VAPPKCFKSSTSFFCESSFRKKHLPIVQDLAKRIRTVGRSVAVISVNSIHTQGHTLGKQVIFPSLVVPMMPGKSATSGWQDHLDIINVEVNSFGFTAGKDSLNMQLPGSELEWRPSPPGLIGHLALIRTALWYLQETTLDLLIVGLPIQGINRHQKSLNKRLAGEHVLPHFSSRVANPLQSRSKVAIRQALVMPRAVIALFAAATEHSIVMGTDTLVLDFGLDALDILCASKMRPIEGQQGCIPGGTSGFIAQLAQSMVESRINLSRYAMTREPMLQQTNDLVDEISKVTTHQTRPLWPHLEQARQVMNHYLDQALSLLPSITEMRLVVLTGSGARLLAPLLPARLPHLSQIITPLNPERTLVNDSTHVIPHER